MPKHNRLQTAQFFSCKQKNLYWKRRQQIIFSSLLYQVIFRFLPLEAARTSLHNISQWESFSTARDESIWPKVSWISEHNFRSVSRSNIPKRTPSSPVSVILIPRCLPRLSLREPSPRAKGLISAKHILGSTTSEIFLLNYLTSCAIVIVSTMATIH